MAVTVATTVGMRILIGLIFLVCLVYLVHLMRRYFTILEISFTGFSLQNRLLKAG
jgi:hypothetical protein